MNPSLSQITKEIEQFRKQKSSELITFKLKNPEEVSGTILFEIYSNSNIIKCITVYGHIKLSEVRDTNLNQLYLDAITTLRRHQSFLTQCGQTSKEQKKQLKLSTSFSKSLYTYYRTKLDIENYQCTKFSRYNSNNIYVIIDEDDNIGFIVEHKDTPLFWYYGRDLDEMLSETCSIIDNYEDLLNNLDPKTQNKI